MYIRIYIYERVRWFAGLIRWEVVLCVCMYVCIYVCTYVYVFVDFCTCISICDNFTQIDVHVHKSDILLGFWDGQYFWKCACMYMHVYMYIYMCVVDVYTYTYIRVSSIIC